MPDVRQLLRARARQQGVRLDILEKDYALSYLLAAIAETPGLESIVLKGGTALKKAYYGNYRFSEDLDYSTVRLDVPPGLHEGVSAAIQRMAKRLNELGPFAVAHEPLTLKEPHPGGQIAYLVRVQFPGQRQPLCRVKLEITVDEPVLLPVQVRPLLHGFDEELPAFLQVYDLAEIVAEKLRALLQSRRQLQRRGWGASRVCRDYYDLWSVLKRGDAGEHVIPDLVQQKCRLRGVTFSLPDDFLAGELLDVARREWQAQLLPFLQQPVAVEQVLSDLMALIPALWE